MQQHNKILSLKKKNVSIIKDVIVKRVANDFTCTKKVPIDNATHFTRTGGDFKASFWPDCF